MSSQETVQANYCDRATQPDRRNEQIEKTMLEERLTRRDVLQSVGGLALGAGTFGLRWTGFRGD